MTIGRISYMDQTAEHLLGLDICTEKSELNLNFREIHTQPTFAFLCNLDDRSQLQFESSLVRSFSHQDSQKEFSQDIFQDSLKFR